MKPCRPPPPSPPPGIMSLGHNLWAYAYLRKLYAKNPDLYYATLAADPALLLPVAYTRRTHAHPDL
jgi:hypothetical protein